MIEWLDSYGWGKDSIICRSCSYECCTDAWRCEAYCLGWWTSVADWLDVGDGAFTM